MSNLSNDVVPAADLPLGQAVVHMKYGPGVLTAFDPALQRITVQHGGERGERVYALEVKGMFKLPDGRCVDSVLPVQPGHTAPVACPNPLLNKLDGLLGDWEHMALVLDNCVFYSMRGFCTDVYVRHAITETLFELEQQCVSLQGEAHSRLHAADARFKANTSPTDICTIDWWQGELARRAEEPWELWVCGQSNPQDNWYLYREPSYV
jgi:hypothetical protein